MGRFACLLGLWTVALLVAAQSTIPLVKKTNPAVISAKLHGGPPKAVPALSARDTIVSSAMKDNGGYMLNISIGTPSQPLAVLVDAAATGLVVMYPGSETEDCSEFRYCAFYGQFDPKNSSTFSSTDEDYENLPEYTTGSDRLILGDVQVADLSFGLIAIDSISSYSSIGVGPQNTSFPYQLVDHGLINTPSFSAWRNPTTDHDIEQDPGDTPGGMIFGGIDASRLTGPLHSFSFRDSLPLMTVPVRGIKVHVDPAANLPSTTNATTTTGPINSTFSETPFDLQTRYVLSYFPLDTVKTLYNALDLTLYRRNDGFYPPPEIPCSRSSENHTITFLIGSAAFDIPWSAFLTPSNIPSQGICSFYITPSDDDELYAGTLGSMILSYLYLAVDYNSMMIGLAPLNANPGEEEIFEIGTETPQFPGGVGNFPESVTAYAPAPSETVVTETSDGWAALRTAGPDARGYMFSGAVGGLLLAVV
ncbi:aspartic peptidase domain-containing protein [Aspergillus californicus]